MLYHSPLFLKILVLCQDARELSKVKIGNLKSLFMMLCADTYLGDTTDCFYNFTNIQKAELCVVIICIFPTNHIFFSSSPLSSNSHVPIDNNGIPEFLNSGRRSWTLDSGRWTLDAGLWTLDAGLWTLDSRR